MNLRLLKVKFISIQTLKYCWSCYMRWIYLWEVRKPGKLCSRIAMKFWVKAFKNYFKSSSESFVLFTFRAFYLWLWHCYALCLSFTRSVCYIKGKLLPFSATSIRFFVALLFYTIWRLTLRDWLPRLGRYLLII